MNGVWSRPRRSVSSASSAVLERDTRPSPSAASSTFPTRPLLLTVQGDPPELGFAGSTPRIVSAQEGVYWTSARIVSGRS